MTTPVTIASAGGTSVGYDGTVDEQAWALNAPHLGKRYGVSGDSWRVTPVAAGDRTVNISAGSGFGWGVFDTLPTDVQLQLDTQASGSRYDIIVARRDWGGVGGGTSLDAITATAAGDIPITRANTPGVLDEQPIALVRVIAGQTVPVIVADLRVWQADGGAFALSDKVLQYLGQPGTAVRIGTTVWSRIQSATGVPSWLARTDPRTEPLVRTWGLTAGTYTPTVRVLTGVTSVTTDANGAFLWNLTGEFTAVHHVSITAFGLEPMAFSVINASLSAYTIRATLNGVPLRSTAFQVQARIEGI